MAATALGAQTLAVTQAATTATISVPTDDDSVAEPTGSVSVTLAAGNGYTIGTGNSATRSVQDNDGNAPEAVSVSLAVADSDTGTLDTGTDTVTVSGVGSGNVDVNLEIDGNLPESLAPTSVTLATDDLAADATAVDIDVMPAVQSIPDEFRFTQVPREADYSLVDIDVAQLDSGSRELAAIGAEVCLPVTASLRAAASATGRNLVLLHYLNGAWAVEGDDDRGDVVCGDVDSFSPFAVGALTSSGSVVEVAQQQAVGILSRNTAQVLMGIVGERLSNAHTASLATDKTATIWSDVETDAGEYDDGVLLPQISSTNWRLRFESEVGYNVRYEGGRIRPYGLFSMRWDDGGAVASGDDFFVDAGAGLLFEMLDSRLVLDVAMRSQFTDDNDTEENSFTGSFSYRAHAGGHGLSLSLEHALPTQTGVWRSFNFSDDEARHRAWGAPRLAAEIGYGWALRMFGGESLLRTWMRPNLNDDRHAIGLDLGLEWLQLELETARENDGLETSLTGKLRF